jgi:hypothetical protein
MYVPVNELVLRVLGMPYPTLYLLLYSSTGVMGMPQHWLTVPVTERIIWCVGHATALTDYPRYWTDQLGMPQHWLSPLPNPSSGVLGMPQHWLSPLPNPSSGVLVMPQHWLSPLPNPSSGVLGMPYLDRRGMKWQEVGEHWIRRSFTSYK